MSVFWRSWVTVCLLVATVLFVLGALATLQYEATLSNLIRGRLVVLAQTARGSFDSALALGLPLTGMRNAQAILERARQTDSKIVAVHAFEPGGRIIHSTDANHADSVRSEVLFSASNASGSFWYTETDEYLLSGADLMTDSRRVVGGVVIVYPQAELETPVRAMIARLAAYGVGVMAFIALLTGAVLRTGLGRVVRVLDALDRALSALERRDWRKPAGGTDTLPPAVSEFGIHTGDLSALAQQADARYIAIGSELAALERKWTTAQQRALGEGS